MRPVPLSCYACGSAVGFVARSLYGSLGAPAAGFANPNGSVCLMLRVIILRAFFVKEQCQAVLSACKNAPPSRALLQGDKGTQKDRKKSVRGREYTHTFLAWVRRLGSAKFGLSILFPNAASYRGQRPYVHTPARPSWGVQKGTQ